MTASPLSTSVALSIAVALLGAFSAADPTPVAHPSPAPSQAARHGAHALPDPTRDHAALGLPSSQGLRLRSSMVDATTGTTVVRYDRTYHGMKVIGGDVLVDLSTTGAVRSVEWNTEKDIAPATLTAAVGTTQALRAGSQRSLAVTGTEAGSATQVIYAASGAPRLAYDVVMEGVKADQTPTRLHTVVDARSGRTLTSWDDIEEGRATGSSSAPSASGRPARPAATRCATRTATTRATSRARPAARARRSPTPTTCGATAP